jgi:predicted nucleic acid-binding Zn ribbon protein
MRSMDYHYPRRRKAYHKGRWALQRERCRIDSPVPAADDREPVAVGDMVGDVMKKLGLAGREWEGILQREWPELVGDDVARHTRPGRVDRKRLVVFVDSSTWLYELKRYSRGRFLGNIQRRVGAGRIESLVFQIDPGDG